MSGKTAFVFATDEGFAPLAKGLVLSMRSFDQDEFDLVLIDIGCSPDTVAWMTAHKVTIKPFTRAPFRRAPKAELKPYQNAQLCRPYLPKLVPGYEVYLWCDTDAWVQDLESPRTYRDCVRSQPDKVAISPLVDCSYHYFYKDSGEFIAYSNVWYRDAYGPTVASTYSRRTVLSSGIFAMHAQNPMWGAWADELEQALQRKWSSHASMHVSEQIVFNYLLYANDKFVPLEALHNYNCHVGCAKRVGGKVVIGIPPFRPIGVIHLTYTGKMIASYISDGLLYDEGRYLSAAERDQLTSISHY